MRHTADSINDDELDSLYERLEAAETAAARVGAALDDAEWGGPDRHDVIAEIRAALEASQTMTATGVEP